MNTIISILASSQTGPPQPVADSGLTALLLGLGVIGLGIVARFLKNKKK